MEEIQSLIAQGELADADARLGARLQLNPTDPTLQFLSGVVKIRLGEGESALNHLQQCLEAVPDHALALLALGQAQRLRGQPVAAQAAFDSAVFLQPQLAGAHALAGELAMFESDRECATALAMKALHQGADDPQAPIVVAAFALQAGEYAAALESLESLSSGNQIATRVAQIVAAARLLQGQLEQCLAAIKLAPAGTSGMTPALRTLQLRALLNTQRQAETEAAAKSFVSEHRESAEAWSLLAEAELKRGQFIHSIEAADSSLAIRPGSSHTLRLKAMAYVRAGKAKVAENLLSAQVTAYPADTKSWRMLLATIIGTSGHKVAQETAQRWVELMPGEADAHGDLAALMEYNGDLDGSMLSARAALRASSGHINALLIAARAELRIGRPGPVLTRLDRVHPSALDIPQKLARLALLARAADASDDQELAVSRWYEKQNSDPSMLNGGSPKHVAQVRIPEHQAVLKVSETMPICFLVGLPGSGVHYVAATLATIPAFCLMGDRFSQQARNDGFARPDWESLELGLREPQAAMLRRRWIKPLQRLKLPGKYQLLIDWLPHLDARLYAAIARAIPEARFLWVDRDMRDSLLDWLAFSSPHRLRFPALGEAGQWYANSHSHLEFAAADQRLPLHRLAYERIGDAGERDRLMAWLGQDSQTLGFDPPHTLGELSAEFPPGHSRKYVDELSAAFQVLPRA